MKVLVYGETGGSGGYIRYCKGLFGSGAVPLNVKVVFICSDRLKKMLGRLDPQVEVITHPWMTSPLVIQRYAWRYLLYRRMAASLCADLEFYPWGQLRVGSPNAKTVVTCHNLLLFDLSQLRHYAQGREKWMLLRKRRAMIKSYRKASAVIFLNQHSKAMVSKQIPDVRNAAVIAHGLEDSFRRLKPRGYSFGPAITVLYVSSIHYYKNHPAVVRGITECRRRTGLDIRLRIVGDTGAGAANDLKRVIRELGVETFVNMIGELPHESLLREYEQADLFCYASSCETFGIILLEAMGARLPIACSNQTGLPKILRDAGVYFNPQSWELIADAIMTLIKSERRRAQLGEMAYRYGLKYTWHRSASQTFALLQRIHKGRDDFDCRIIEKDTLRGDKKTGVVTGDWR